MTPVDFRRNFQQSYFGLHPQYAKAALSSAEWDSLDLTAQVPLIPCTNPAFNTAESRCEVHGVFKVGDTVFTRSFLLHWKKDLDEDTSVIVTKAPLIGMVQHYSTSLFLRRSPARQFNRGYVPRVCSAYCPNINVLDGEHNVSTSDYMTVWRVFNPLYFKFAEALEQLDAGNYIGVALSRLLAIVCEERRKYPLVYYRDTAVGFVQGKNSITVYDDTPEPVQDYIYKITKAEIKVK